MPQYLFSNAKTGEVHTIVLHMNEEKVYLGPDGKAKPGLWRRVWTSPRASVDTRVDPHSAKDFLKATAKKDTVGAMWDRSKEMHLKRAEKDGGHDHVQQGYFDRYSKAHKGRKHIEQKRQDTAREAAKAGIRVDWGNDD